MTSNYRHALFSAVSACTYVNRPDLQLQPVTTAVPDCGSEEKNKSTVNHLWLNKRHLQCKRRCRRERGRTPGEPPDHCQTLRNLRRSHQT
ncbi:hypothetical protein CesoFtcFv8_014837 [Champsocephalus esox]|uniref:Uncharacterized protein n=2 Tax=Champsocephalus TaxID=52236 RepID=A0AAN8DE87_CHAGU|nr:hypothetical protein CesoFtcFv8_014837 [Champsocephalus esox]KAK5919293.1 hypothetical protein CgunFtcFv8_023196 [Champsocephalus gunnari]